MIAYPLAQYLTLLAQRTKEKPLPGLKTKYLPGSYTFKTEATVEKLEEMVLANGFMLEADLEVLRIYQHESGLLHGSIPFPGMASYGKIVMVNHHKEFEYKEAVSGVPAMIYHSCFRYKTQGRKHAGKVEVVAKVTEGIMQTLFAEQFPAFWMMEGARQLPVVVGNFPEKESFQSQ